MQYLDAISKTTVISICFQGKPLSITVIQVYAPTNNAEEAQAERFYEDLQYFLELSWIIIFWWSSRCWQFNLWFLCLIQVYALTSNTEEAEVEQFYEDLQNLIEHPKKMSFSL